jgi:uncharacterized protein YbaR (Trm112 family)
MFIEVAEILRCPRDHEPTYCVVTTNEMVARRVLRGVLGCPVCAAEYPIIDGIVEFGVDPLFGSGARSDDLTVEEMPDAPDVLALLGITDPGGYAVLMGSVARLGSHLAALVPGIHFVAVNPPPDVGETDFLSVVRTERLAPIASNMVRGVVLGKEYSMEPWLSEGARILLNGLRLVAVREDANVPGLEKMASGRGMWVGRKLAK